MKRIAIAIACTASLIGVTAPMASAAPSKSYSAAEVATHASKKDCWSIVDGKVYNLTKWINRHPGGSSRIIGMCGKDASKAFHGQHSGGGRAGSLLKQYKIGKVG